MKLKTGTLTVVVILVLAVFWSMNTGQQTGGGAPYPGIFSGCKWANGLPKFWGVISRGDGRNKAYAPPCKSCESGQSETDWYY